MLCRRDLCFSCPRGRYDLAKHTSMMLLPFSVRWEGEYFGGTEGRYKRSVRAGDPERSVLSLVVLLLPGWTGELMEVYPGVMGGAQREKCQGVQA